MRRRARNWFGSLATVALAAALSGCVTDYLPEPGKGPPAVSPIKAFSMGEAPIKGADARFAFAPITGAPAAALITANGALTQHATERQLTVVPDGDPTATYIVRGYLSAVGDRQSSLLVYVWDVFDRNGKRLHRFSGQENGSGSKTDPWQGIREATIRSAARSTIDDLKAWSD